MEFALCKLTYSLSYPQSRDAIASKKQTVLHEQIGKFVSQVLINMVIGRKQTNILKYKEIAIIFFFQLAKSLFLLPSLEYWVILRDWVLSDIVLFIPQHFTFPLRQKWSQLTFCRTGDSAVSYEMLLSSYYIFQL